MARWHCRSSPPRRRLRTPQIPPPATPYAPRRWPCAIARAISHEDRHALVCPTQLTLSSSTLVYVGAKKAFDSGAPILRIRAPFQRIRKPFLDVFHRAPKRAGKRDYTDFRQAGGKGKRGLHPHPSVKTNRLVTCYTHINSIKTIIFKESLTFFYENLVSLGKKVIFAA